MAWVNPLAATSCLEEKYQEFLDSAHITDPSKFQLKLLTAEEVLTQTSISHCPSIGAVEIPYFGLNGKPINFKRYRFLNYTGKNKYIQASPGVEVYYPPTVDWAQIANSPAVPIFITEGEKKAIAGTLNGFVTVGLGGIYSFSSVTDQWFNNVLTSSLQDFKWKDREVYIVFDYDGDGTGQPKPQVRQAELILTAQLKARRAHVRHVRLGEVNSFKKVGLDDMLARSRDLFISKIHDSVKDSQIDSGLAYLLSEYANYEGKVLKLSNGRLMSWSDFTHSVAKYSMEDGNEASRAWRRSKWRLDIEAVDMLPNDSERITKDKVYNTWAGIQTIPVAGDVTPWLKFKHDLFSREPHLEKHFDMFIASLLQNPGHKQYRLPIIRGTQGAGKSFLFESIVFVINGNRDSGLQFGTGAVELGPSDLDDSFNEILGGKAFALFNEPGEIGNRHTALIKNLVTGNTLAINGKFRPKYSTKNHLHMAFTTNMAYTHIIEYDARREMVAEVDAAIKRKTSEYFDNNSLPSWRNDHLGEILYWYLNYDLGSYTGRTPAPQSEARNKMVRRSAPPVMEYIREELKDVPYLILGLEYNLFIDMYFNGNAKLTKRAFRHFLEDEKFVPHIRADKSGFLELGAYGFGKVHVMCKDGYQNEASNPKIVEHLGKRYRSDK